MSKHCRRPKALVFVTKMRSMTGVARLERSCQTPISTAPMTATAQRILVVDDDPEIRKLLARYIESQGFRVLLAANCRELRERLATHQSISSCST